MWKTLAAALLLVAVGPSVAQAQPPRTGLCEGLTADQLTRCLYSDLDDRLRKLEPSPPPTTAPPTTAPPGGTAPNGPTGTWSLKFSDEFSGAAVDTRKWADTSSAESDGGRGNPGNKQLEYNLGRNCSVADGALTITAKREQVQSSSGRTYNWTSCLLTTTPSYAFRYGYVETRAKLPAVRGFWPAFWTWQAPGVNSYIETDVFEFYSDNPNRLYLSQHSGSGGGCILVRPNGFDFNPSGGFHTYGADITANGTDFYIDGRKVCTASGTSTGNTNLILDQFVFADVPPAAGTTSAQTQFDYVRAWQR